MGKIYEALDEKLIDFISRQKVFFVATAPLSAEGHVNLSPKGYDAFKVIDETTIAWLDLGGSGIETQAHVQETVASLSCSALLKVLRTSCVFMAKAR